MRPPLLLTLALLTACSRSPLLAPADDDADLAEQYYAAKRQGTSDPQRAYAIARARMRSLRETESRELTTENRLQWSFLGPGNIGGRTRTLVIDSDDPNVMYAGGVSGGVWKSANGGAGWDAIADDLVNLAVNSMVMDPRDHDVLYVGTGEGYFREEVRGTGLPLRGNGIFVTRDGGATWQQLASTTTSDFQWVNDLAISAHDSRRIYAATRSGVWRSIDAGENWTRVLMTTVKGGCLDLAMRSDTPADTLFASCGTFEQATVYRSMQAERDDTWNAVLSEPGMGRTTLAIAPSQPSTIYALAAANSDQQLLAVYRSDAGGDAGTWIARVRRDDPEKLNTLLLTNPITATQKECGGVSDNPLAMGWYCNTIAVDPANPERVFAGGVDLFRSDDGGTNWGVASYWWRQSASYVHADQHNIVFDPRSSRTLYLTNDGGVYRTENADAPVARGARATCSPDNSQVVFTSLANNYGVTQFYHGAVFPDGKRFLGGAQDNSTLVGSAGSGAVWESRIGGDGGYVAVDSTNPQHVYAEFQNGNLFRSDDGGSTFRAAPRLGLSDDFLFVTPYVLDPNLTNRLWIGGTHMWRSETRGDAFLPASAKLAGQVSAIAVAPQNSDRVFAGTTSGFIYSTNSATTSNGNTLWTRIQPREGWVSSLTFDRSDTSILYATYAGFGGRHVWKSVDDGTNWSAIDGDLPDVPIHSLVIDPSRSGHLFLGSDLGVFETSDGGRSWDSTGFPDVVTEWITIAQGERGPALYAFTHGRGAWRAELSPAVKRRAVHSH